MQIVRSPSSAGAVEVGAILATVVDGDAGHAVVTAGNDSTNIAISGPDAWPDRSRRVSALLEAALDEIADGGGGPVHWWVQGATAADESIAKAHGLRSGRTLFQLRRRLPTGLPVEIQTRPFRPGVDDAAWLRLNNRAFSGHPEQGGWTAATLARRMAEPWFDPAGLLLHERDGRLAGSCWTKLHEAAAAEPAMGEIYVIGVDPDFHGLGLGPQLTLAGLASIADRGVTVGMLYVDAANAPAVRMYDRLGFELNRTDQAYVIELPERSVS